MFQSPFLKRKIRKIIKKSLLRQKSNPIFHRPVYINNQPTNIQLIKIKDEKTLLEYVAPKRIDSQLVYLYEKKWNLQTYYFRYYFDVILCDNGFNVIQLLPNQSSQKNVEGPEKTFNIWICKAGFIAFHKIKIGDIVSTKPTYQKIIKTF